MAVLNKIRQRSLVLIIVIAMALFAFVVGDIFKSSDFLTGGSQDVVATINGEDIGREDFQRKVKNYQDGSRGRVTSTQAMNAIYNQELRNIIMQTEYDEIGLSVEKDEMRDLLKNTYSSYPEFLDENGVFDVNRLNAFIANLKEINPKTSILTINGQSLNVNYQSWTNSEQNIARNALQQSYYNMIKAGIGTTIAEAEAEYLGDAKTVDIRYVQIPYTSIADSLVKVSKTDIQNYIKENEEKYKVDATREIAYVEFSENASKADEDDIKAGLLKLRNDQTEYNKSSKNTDTIPGFDTTTNITEFVNSNSDINYNDSFLRPAQLPAVAKDSLLKLNIDDYYGPYRDGDYFKLSKLIATKQLADSVKSSHIIVPYVGSQNLGPGITRSRQDAKAIVDSLLPLVKNNKSKFGTVASQINSDGSKNTNGEVGWTSFSTFDPSKFDPNYANFIYNNVVGSVEIVESQYGYHIIRIDDAKNYEKAIKVATLADKVEASDQTLQDVFNGVSKFEIAAKDGDFNTLAKERELTVKPITVKALDENISTLGSQRQIVRWAFNDDTDTNEFKRFAVPNIGFVVVKLVKKSEEGLMSVEDASAAALPEIRKEKKAAMIRGKITATSINDISTNQEQGLKSALALTMNNITLSGAGAEPKVIGVAFGLPEGGTSKPIDGDKGIYVIEVTKITEATKLDNYTSIMNRLNTAIKSGVQTNVYSALEKAADIEDNRAKTVY